MTFAVFRVSKLKSLKAIHNISFDVPRIYQAVFRVSKLKSLKAIHNILNEINIRNQLFSEYQS